MPIYVVGCWLGVRLTVLDFISCCAVLVLGCRLCLFGFLMSVLAVCLS